MEKQDRNEFEVAELKNIFGKSLKSWTINEQGQLIALRFSSSDLSQPLSKIGQLTNLQQLALSNTGLTQLPPEIGQLTNLQRLDLRNTGLTQLPPEIGQLTNLQQLSLTGTQLSQLPPEISQLTNLQRLALTNSRLNQFPLEIIQLTNLHTLYLVKLPFIQIPPEIIKLTNLHMLSFHHTPLTQLPPEIGQLTNLQRLDLSNTGLTQLPPEIGQLTNLQQLALSNTGLTQLPPEIGQLTNLQQLDLSNTSLTQLPPEINQLTNLQTLNLNKTHHLLTPPPEIVAQGVQEILAFFQALQRDSVTRYEGKLIIVGEGGTGKSSLLRALDGKKFEASLETTHGIEVKVLQLPHPFLPECSLVLNTWDFGGQDIYHATHQFFLTKRSLYLVVWNARTGDEQSKLDFWLKTIRVRAPEAPILLVATHIDERAPDLNTQQYRKAYPQIVKDLQISSKTGDGLQNLRDTITQYAAKLPLMGQPWPTSWVEAEQDLLKRSEHHIDVGTYIDLCKAKGIGAEIAQGEGVK